MFDGMTRGLRGYWHWTTRGPVRFAAGAGAPLVAMLVVLGTVTGGGSEDPAPVPTPSGALLSVHYFDVGQGDASLLLGPDFTVLIDAGRHDRTDVVPHLQSAGVTTIDLFIATHPHADHIGQASHVLEAFPVREVWASGDTTTTRTFERFLDAVDASDAGYHEPRAGETQDLGAAFIEVVSPAVIGGDLNEGSVAVRVTYGAVVFLFTGDAETGAEAGMLERGHELTAHVLQLGHHGSRTSSTQPFLSAVQPEVAVYSAGVNSQFGHPHDEVLERLAAMDVDVYGTAEHGTIVITTNGLTYDVQTETGSGPRGPPEAGTPQPSPVAATPSACVDVNTASFEGLQEIIHIGPGRAAEIMELRPFSSVDDLTRVGGIGPANLAAIKEQGLACVG